MIAKERGFALVGAVFALAIIGAIVTGYFFAARLEQQSGRNAFYVAQVVQATEAGLSEAMTTMQSATLETMAIGGAPLDLGTIAVGSGLEVRRRLSRLTSSLFLVRVEGVRQDADGSALAMRVVGALVRLASPAGPVVRLTERGWLQLD